MSTLSDLLIISELITLVWLQNKFLFHASYISNVRDLYKNQRDRTSNVCKTYWRVNLVWLQNEIIFLAL